MIVLKTRKWAPQTPCLLSMAAMCLLTWELSLDWQNQQWSSMSQVFNLPPRQKIFVSFVEQNECLSASRPRQSGSAGGEGVRRKTTKWWAVKQIKVGGATFCLPGHHESSTQRTDTHTQQLAPKIKRAVKTPVLWGIFGHMASTPLSARPAVALLTFFGQIYKVN